MPRFRLVAVVLLLLGLLAPAAAARSHGGHDPFPDQIALPDGFAPEGITTGRGTTVFAGSLAGGAIWRGDVRTGEGDVITPATGTLSVGLDYDVRRDLLWVAGGPTGTVRAIDASTGDVLATYKVEGGFLNDVVVTRDAVYVSDSFMQQLVVLPLPDNGSLPDQDDVTVLPLTGDIAYVPDEFNANGIVARAGYLVLVQSNTGQLFRVDPDTGEAVEIDLDTALTAGDGLELVGSTLYVVRNQLNQVAVVRLTGNLTRADVVDTLTEDGFDVPTTITLAAGRLWAVNARFGTTPTPDTVYWITQVSRR